MRAWLAIVLMMLSPLAALAADMDDKACDVTVMFGSTCCGTDFNTYKSVKTILDQDETLSVRRIPWGQEGEFTMCVNTMSDEQIQPLYDKIKASLPVKTDQTRGYTSVRMKGQEGDQ